MAYLIFNRNRCLILGGGSGGSIAVIVDSMTGSGIVDVSGGAGGTATAGALGFS
jgi:hypothetical protein